MAQTLAFRLQVQRILTRALHDPTQQYFSRVRKLRCIAEFVIQPCQRALRPPLPDIMSRITRSRWRDEPWRLAPDLTLRGRRLEGHWDPAKMPSKRSSLVPPEPIRVMERAFLPGHRLLFWSWQFVPFRKPAPVPQQLLEGAFRSKIYLLSVKERFLVCAERFLKQWLMPTRFWPEPYTYSRPVP